PNGVGRFFGYADSAAAFLQQVLQHRNSPSLLEKTGDVRAVRMEDYDKKGPNCAFWMQFDMALVSIHVSNLQVVRQGANYPNSEAEFLPQAPSTRVKCITLAHSREVSCGVCSHFVDRRQPPTPPPLTLQLSPSSFA
ncbi:unnamed protein product, partial [Mesocestoides corti]|uniref:RES domain-containing protein n=1 Tax=Mesocestoides corti TaxID=53468 RepID=A0A0R3UDG4_MESCO